MFSVENQRPTPAARPHPKPRFNLEVRSNDGDWARADIAWAKAYTRQKRRAERKLERQRRLELLSQVRESIRHRQLERALLRELGEMERDRDLFGARMRMKVREQRERRPAECKSKPGHRLTRRLPRYAQVILDAQGRRGVFMRTRYVKAGGKDSRRGCARRFWLYTVREGAVELTVGGEPVFHSNMGETIDEVAGAWELQETISRASRSNAKLQFRMTLALPHDVSPEERLEIVERFCDLSFATFDLPFSAVVHTPDDDGDERNYHAHVMFSFRPMIRVADGEWEVGRELRTDLDNPSGMSFLREAFALCMTEVAQESALVEPGRVYTALSHVARGLRIVPTEHVGAKATAAYRRGESSPAIERNTATIQANELHIELDRLEARLQALQQLKQGLEDKMAESRLDAGLSMPISLKGTEGAIGPITIHTSAFGGPDLFGMKVDVNAVGGNIARAQHTSVPRLAVGARDDISNLPAPIHSEQTFARSVIVPLPQRGTTAPAPTLATENIEADLSTSAPALTLGAIHLHTAEISADPLLRNSLIGAMSDRIPIQSFGSLTAVAHAQRGFDPPSITESMRLIGASANVISPLPVLTVAPPALPSQGAGEEQTDHVEPAMAGPAVEAGSRPTWEIAPFLTAGPGTARVDLDRIRPIQPPRPLLGKVAADMAARAISLPPGCWPTRLMRPDFLDLSDEPRWQEVCARLKPLLHAEETRRQAEEARQQQARLAKDLEMLKRILSLEERDRRLLGQLLEHPEYVRKTGSTFLPEPDAPFDFRWEFQQRFDHRNRDIVEHVQKKAREKPSPASRPDILGILAVGESLAPAKPERDPRPKPRRKRRGWQKGHERDISR